MAPLGPLIKVSEDMFKTVERMLKYRFWDKERERSNRAAGLREQARGLKRRCYMRHDRIAWSGPPHDRIRAYVCLWCNAAACEPEIKDMGYDFETVPDWVLVGWSEWKNGVLIYHPGILDLDLQRQAEGNATNFFISGEPGGTDF